MIKYISITPFLLVRSVLNPKVGRLYTSGALFFFSFTGYSEAVSSVTPSPELPAQALVADEDTERSTAIAESMVKVQASAQALKAFREQMISTNEVLLALQTDVEAAREAFSQHLQSLPEKLDIERTIEEGRARLLALQASTETRTQEELAEMHTIRMRLVGASRARAMLERATTLMPCVCSGCGADANSPQVPLHTEMKKNLVELKKQVQDAEQKLHRAIVSQPLMAQKIREHNRILDVYNDLTSTASAIPIDANTEEQP